MSDISTDSRSDAASQTAGETEINVRLDRLPRTVELVRDGQGKAVFSYVDERELPRSVTVVKTRDWCQVIDAIKTLAVRGAPAIGVSGAAAVALWACNEGCAVAATYGCSESIPRFMEAFNQVADEVSDARPTAVNLAWGVDQMRACAQDHIAAGQEPAAIADALFDRVKVLEAEDEATNRSIGDNGAALLPYGARVLTHCNAGSLATVFYGTALGVIYTAACQGKIARVYADETRPVGQGARLSAWELAQAGIPCTLICDNMAASLMSQGLVDAVVVGADRIAANGDTANKIGTYGVAVLAQYHHVPFFVAAPTSTIDFSLANGADIPIEQRDPHEVTPYEISGVNVWNPAFDVTPAALITRIVTERGVVRPEELGLIASE